MKGGKKAGGHDRENAFRQTADSNKNRIEWFDIPGEHCCLKDVPIG